MLRTDKKTPLPTPPDYHPAKQTATAVLENWVHCLNEETPGEDTPEKLIYLLDHAYSIAELNFDALKNRDAANADLLLSAAHQADCECYLALVSIEESGRAEYIGYDHYNRWGTGCEDEDDFEIGEVFEHLETISKWRGPDGNHPALPTLPFNEKEFCPPEAFDAMEPDNIQFHEATGNEGASFDRMYHRAALVLWPRARYLAIINQAGLTAALPVLKDLTEQWENSKTDETKQEAHQLATYLLKDWLPDHCAQSSGYGVSQHKGSGLASCIAPFFLKKIKGSASLIFSSKLGIVILWPDYPE